MTETEQVFCNVNIRNRQKLKITWARLEDLPTVPENCVEQIGSRESDNIVNCNGAIRLFVVSGDHLCRILAENPDGTLLAHIPVEWVKIIPPRQLTDELKNWT